MHRPPEVGLGAPCGVPAPAPSALFPTSWVGDVAREAMDGLQSPGALLLQLRAMLKGSAVPWRGRTITAFKGEEGRGHKGAH